MLLTVNAFFDCLLSALCFCDDVGEKCVNMFSEKFHMFTADFWFEKMSPETNKDSNLCLCYLANAIYDLWPSKLTNKVVSI